MWTALGALKLDQLVVPANTCRPPYLTSTQSAQRFHTRRTVRKWDWLCFAILTLRPTDTRQDRCDASFQNNPLRCVSYKTSEPPSQPKETAELRARHKDSTRSPTMRRNEGAADRLDVHLPSREPRRCSFRAAVGGPPAPPELPGRLRWPTPRRCFPRPSESHYTRRDRESCNGQKENRAVNCSVRGLPICRLGARPLCGLPVPNTAFSAAFDTPNSGLSR